MADYDALMPDEWFCDDGAFEKIIGGVAIAGKFAGMAGVTLVGNRPINPCYPQSATPG